MGSGKTNTEDHAELQRAAEQFRPIARAASIARSNGMSLLVFGVIGLLLSLAGFDPLDFSIGLVLTVTGFVEVHTSRRLALADVSAPARLARNELVLMLSILIYSVLRLTLLRGNGSELTEQLSSVRGMSMDMGELADSLNTLIYTTFIAVTVLYQGGMARYFARRRPMVEAYVRDCPDWARRVVGDLRN